MVLKSIVGVVGMVLALSGGGQPRSIFTAVGVYMDDARVGDDNMHIVGTWALNIDLPSNSTTAQVQTAAQNECAKTARSGLRCAEMGQINLDVGNNRSHPCAVMALGVYRHKGRDYTLWPLKFGFDTSDAAKAWGRAELRRLPSENDNDPLIREVSVSTNCTGPSS